MGHCIAPNEFVLLVDIHMILLAIVIVPLLLDGPTGVGIFLSPFDRVLLPLGGTFPSFKPRVLHVCIPLLGHRHERDINQLSPSRVESLIGQVGVKLFKQSFGYDRLPQGFVKQPDRFRIGNALGQIEAEESRNDKRSQIDYSACSSDNGEKVD